MQCDEMRVAISALTDGEDPGAAAGETTRHLAGCPACQEWQDAADAVSRTVWESAPPAPDLTERVLVAVADDRSVRSARRTGRGTRPPRAASGHPRAARPHPATAHQQVLRIALAVAAGIQLTLALPALWAGFEGVGPHAGRETSSFELAVAIGFLVAAWRPGYARALVPVGVALSLCLLVTSAVDVANSTTFAAHELGHLIVAIETGLLVLLARAGRPPAAASSDRAPRAAA